MRKPFIAANWKMYKSPEQTAEFFRAFLPLVERQTRDDVAIFPSAICLPGAVALTAGANVFIGGQNMHWQSEGAYTGETSAPMLTGAGATHILVGHSERRQHFGETDQQVNWKVIAALQHGLVPLMCVGETDAEREAGHTTDVLSRQISLGLHEITAEQAQSIVIAYEPVWAIGTGKTATPEQAGEAHLHIRETLSRLFGRGIAEGIRILYGGSVKPENVSVLMNQPEIDGALVGGASLDPKGFAAIVRYGVR